jgi:hypothetical protein
MDKAGGTDAEVAETDPESRKPRKRRVPKHQRPAAAQGGRAEELLDFLRRAGRTLAETSLKNVATIFALAGLLFYVVGLARRVAILEAEGIPTSRGLPLTSLQDYLLQGLAVIIDPNTLGAIAVWVLVIGAILVSPGLAVRVKATFADVSHEENADAQTTGEPQTSNGAEESAPATADQGPLWKRRVRGLVSGFFLAVFWAAVLYIVIFIAAGIIYLPFAAWVPLVLSFLVAVIVIAVSKLRVLRVPPWRTWTHVHARLVGATLVAMVLIYVLTRIVLAPPPLDTATLHLKSGRECAGGLLASTNNALYLVDRSPQTGAAKIRAFPVGQLASLEIAEGPPRRYASLAHEWGWTDKKWPVDVGCEPYPGLLNEMCQWLEERE